MNKQNLTKVVLLTVFMTLAISACAPGAPATQTFLPLPPPANGSYPANIVYEIKGGNQTFVVRSNVLDTDYYQTGSGAGGTASETVRMKILNKEGTTLEVEWGDWQSGKIQTVEYYDSKGNLILGRVRLNVDSMSIFQWLAGNFKYTINRSRLYLEYTVSEPGATPSFNRVIYNELWGATDQDRWAMGLTAHWTTRLEKILPPQYQKWGFWESRSSPFMLVTQALEAVEQSIGANMLAPDFHVVDQDSARELIGRQTGFHAFRNGNKVGTIEFNYDNGWGQQPNTPVIGSGALSKIEVRMDGKYRALLILSPALSPVPSSLYVFVDNEVTADTIWNSRDWTVLYQQLKQGAIPGVTLAVHGMGSITKITASGSTSGSESKSVTVNVGNGGGIHYATFGKPKVETVIEARNFIALMGEPGIRTLGLYYPYAPGSGSGLDYYLSNLILMVSDPDKVIDVLGFDVSLLDRVGVPTSFTFK